MTFTRTSLRLRRVIFGLKPVSHKQYHTNPPWVLMKRVLSDFPESTRAKRARRNMTTTTIELTARERQLREFLLDVAKHIEESTEPKTKIELRWAGGWVRDKLLSIQSHDIDTAISTMTGYVFATKMQEFLEHDKSGKYSSPENGEHILGNLHKVLANPDKSKHLETATTKIYGYDVDFVNLRKETYSEDSRNPQMEFGTAEEDALRRDATINALFYNLHSDRVEDFTTGLNDLAEKRIRTPLEPRTTFMDDPLRVLRLIRFASRLDFAIDPESEKFMSDPAVLEALKLKISRERVGVEVEKMLKAKNPRSALQLFDRLGLYSTIFTDPTLKDIAIPSTENWSVVYDVLEELKANETPGSIYNLLVRSDDAKFLSWVLAALVPWSKIPQSVKKGKKEIGPLGMLVAREGIKANNKICNVVAGAFNHFGEITALRDASKAKDESIMQRDKVGMSIRRWETQGTNWRLHALFAILVEVMEKNDPSAHIALYSKWQAFFEHLESMDLMDVASERPLVDGKELVKKLGAKPGPWMRPALDVCMEWQLRNPGVEDTTLAVEEVRSRKEELKIPM